MPGEKDLALLLAGLRPRVQAGTYVFAVVPPEAVDLRDEAVVTVREAEGMTVVVAREVAERHALAYEYEAAWITLTVRSDLDAVGLTGAVAAALARRGISCNVVAGFHHDHLFVPADRCEDALHALRALGGS